MLILVMVPCMVFWFGTGNSRGLRDGTDWNAAGVRILVDNEPLDVENFVISMISVDYLPEMEEEALKAFSVAARSSLYAHIEKYMEQEILPEESQLSEESQNGTQSQGQRTSVIEADELGISCYGPEEMVLAFQEAASAESGKHWSSVYQRVKSAVEATAGEYLVYPEMSETMPVDILWHEISAGSTRFYAGNLTGQEDGISLYSPQLKSMNGNDGTLSCAVRIIVYTRRELAELLWEVPGTEDILDEEKSLSSYFSVDNRDDAGYIEELNVGNRKMTGEEAARLLQVSSGCFYVSDIPEDRLKIVVCGSGRGYGMSLAGASFMSLQGADYRKILEYYFPVCELNNSTVFWTE